MSSNTTPRAVAHATALAKAPPVLKQETPPAETSADKSRSDEVAALAYSYWESRGCEGGSPEEDWYRAEAELAQKINAEEG